ncbi:histidine phosphatase family protein [Acidovorax sp. Root70]|uniref:histidine phosphatase family protein n=1 Tax=Acidovorax sp. Root70 TaxID=1736590 RepID=UPI0006F4354D|nr:histidine phosphatase family protein [Acidovorax sp. Root70]KRB26864.1 phosphoglycerate kinase [Acidovorax sp. Root70]
MTPSPAAASSRLWLVRHAAPLVAPGTCYGALDVRADTQATRAAAERLSTALPPGVRVAHSTLQRCELLAHDLQALRPDLTFTPDARLREMDFGRWEGKTWDAIGKSAIDAWVAGFATHAPGGGESLAHMLHRVAAALQTAREWRTDQGAKDMVWITHAGVARCVAWLQERGESALPRSEDWPVAAPGWGEWEIRELA